MGKNKQAMLDFRRSKDWEQKIRDSMHYIKEYGTRQERRHGKR